MNWSAEEVADVAYGLVTVTSTVPLPAGARVEQMAAAGGRIVLRVASPGGERLVVLDPALGTVGTFVLAPGK